MGNPGDSGEGRLARLIDELASSHEIEAFSNRGPWTSMAAILLDGRFGKRWDRSVFLEAYRRMATIAQCCGTEEADEFLNHLFTSFQTFRQLLPSLDILWSGGLDAVTRTRMLAIPAYTTLIEGCYSNLARAILVPLSRSTGKNYTAQNKLGPITDALRSNSFPLLAAVSDTNVRNAINHGGVNVINASGFGSCAVKFTYTEHGERRYETMNSSLLEAELFTKADALRGALLGAFAAIDAQDTSGWIDSIADEHVRLMLKGFALGSEDLWCLDANATTANPQLNLTFETKKTDRIRLYVEAERIFAEAAIALPGYNRYLLAFSNPRLAANFLRAEREDIEKFLTAGREAGQLVQSIIERGEVMWFEPNDEDVNLAEALFHVFPFYDDGEMSILDVEDVSGDDRKRLKAKVFTCGKQSRTDVINIAKRAIAWVKELHNPPSPRMRVKHGDMPADCVYLDIYRDELDSNRSLAEGNENFICEVEYCPNEEFRLTGKNGFIAYIYNNAEWVDRNTKILWRDRGNLTRNNRGKVGRNDPCPCGSGRKYKKCCGA